ncbi:hypothetical protein FJB88_22465 [Salmonella enterica subsp. enterica]|uniref:Uncharacterized protein n=1 Tax=Salmonella typhimurium (strain SL1344) TaxID=216597 RepID=A0A718Y403_SALTS|nr:hypothetical protein [Salmonella enterica subsp. enterica]HAD6864664.1 hypothetical protein [Salmonella enterica subsp. enterica serovar Typhimurium str. SL1344]
MQLSTTESEPQRGPHDSAVDNLRTEDKTEKIAVRLLHTLVSGPDGPLTRRYAPTSGKPSSGPLRPRTEALSWLKAGMVWQGRGWVR